MSLHLSYTPTNLNMWLVVHWTWSLWHRRRYSQHRWVWTGPQPSFDSGASIGTWRNSYQRLRRPGARTYDAKHMYHTLI